MADVRCSAGPLACTLHQRPGTKFWSGVLFEAVCCVSAPRPRAECPWRARLSSEYRVSPPSHVLDRSGCSTRGTMRQGGTMLLGRPLSPEPLPSSAGIDLRRAKRFSFQPPGRAASAAACTTPPQSLPRGGRPPELRVVWDKGDNCSTRTCRNEYSSPSLRFCLLVASRVCGKSQTAPTTSWAQNLWWAQVGFSPHSRLFESVRFNPTGRRCNSSYC